jgi:hypothetical protein
MLPVDRLRDPGWWSEEGGVQFPVDVAEGPHHHVGEDGASDCGRSIQKSVESSSGKAACQPISAMHDDVGVGPLPQSWALAGRRPRLGNRYAIADRRAG